MILLYTDRFCLGILQEGAVEDTDTIIQTPKDLCDTVWNGSRPSHELIAKDSGRGMGGEPTSLPKYIKQLPREFGLISAVLPAYRQCLCIPGDPLRNELLQNYVRLVRPYCPVICATEIMTAVETNGQNGEPINLLLFQAIMFAGSTFASEEGILLDGFPSRKSAQHELLKRLQLLYELDVEKDQTVVLQSLLTATASCGLPCKIELMWSWLGDCVEIAQELGLHLQSRDIDLGDSQKRLHRALWWLSFSKEQVLAFVLQRQSRVTLKDDIVDGVVDPQCPEPHGDTCRGSSFCSSICGTVFAELLASKIRLSLCLHNILADQDEFLSQKPRSGTSVTSYKHEMRRVVERYYGDLRSWLQNSHYNVYDDAEQAPSSTIHRAELRILFYVVLGLLEHIRLTEGIVEPSQNSALTQDPLDGLRHVTLSVLKIANSLKTDKGMKIFYGITVIPLLIVYNQVAVTAFAAIGWIYYIVFIFIPACGLPIIWFQFLETNNLFLEEIAAVFGEEVALGLSDLSIEQKEELDEQIVKMDTNALANKEWTVPNEPSATIVQHVPQ
ncbi:Fungal specific transcription factor domain-containing protein [Cladophialophora immunda]|nr:Fungal specific transcription factor domain-containing protein [Cladophialophora immunda]